MDEPTTTTDRNGTADHPGRLPGNGSPWSARKARQHATLTTGEVAALLDVAPRTVAKWCDSGKLSHYRIPCSADRRVPRDRLLAFCVAESLPVPHGLTCGVLLACVPQHLSDVALAGPLFGVPVDHADTLAAAAYLLGRRCYALAVVGAPAGRAGVLELGRAMAAERAPTRRVYLAGDDEVHPGELKAAGWEVALGYGPAELARLLSKWAG